MLTISANGFILFETDNKIKCWRLWSRKEELLKTKIKAKQLDY